MMIQIEQYPISGILSGIMVADWGTRVAFIDVVNGKLCIYDTNNRSIVKCADVPKRLTNRGWGLPLWKNVSGRTISGVFVYVYDDVKAGYLEFTVTPDDISVGQPVEVSINTHGADIYATWTFPRLWVRDAGNINCVDLIDFESKTVRTLGCYGPSGYSIWPVVVYDGATDLGSGKWLLSSHHYWIVGSFAYLHIIDRYNGSPSRSYTSYDSCSGSFSAHDKIVGGIWHRHVVAWGRSAGFETNSCIYVFRQPFSNPLRFVNPIPGNPVIIAPLYATEDGYIILQVISRPGVRRTEVRVMKWTASGLSVLEESPENISWGWHEPAIMYYDERRNAMVVTFISVDYILYRIVVFGYTGDIGTTMSRMLPKYILKSDGSIQLVAAGRLVSYEPESQAEVVFYSGPPPGPTPTWTKWLWLILLILAIVAVSLYIAKRR